jgi:hypothetical protein
VRHLIEVLVPDEYATAAPHRRVAGEGDRIRERALVPVSAERDEALTEVHEPFVGPPAFDEVRRRPQVVPVGVIAQVPLAHGEPDDLGRCAPHKPFLARALDRRGPVTEARRALLSLG